MDNQVNVFEFYQSLTESSTNFNRTPEPNSSSSSVFTIIPYFPLESTTATFNRILCMEHALQLSVRKALQLDFVNTVVAGVCDTSLFFRKSATDASYLTNVQKSGSTGTRLKLILDVPSRF